MSDASAAAREVPEFTSEHRTEDSTVPSIESITAFKDLMRKQASEPGRVIPNRSLISMSECAVAACHPEWFPDEPLERALDGRQLIMTQSQRDFINEKRKALGRHPL